ncbi:MAG: hypothetical protein ACLQDV_25175 [Candidatus Binataceae bacterium]
MDAYQPMRSTGEVSDQVLVIALLMAASFAPIGLYWDISWHISIGRDTVWTPPHLLIYLCCFIAAIAGSAAIFVQTKSSNLKNQSGHLILVCGLKGRLGAFIAVHGAFAMVLSAPFDNWWHQAYGLDVRILSPPHVVLLLGMAEVCVASIVTLKELSSTASVRARYYRVRLQEYSIACLLMLCALALYDNTRPGYMHDPRFYWKVLALMPAPMMVAAVTGNKGWSATVVAGIYSMFWLAALWTLPLFSASPRLGPVYQPIQTFVPLGAPLLLVAPAISIDCLYAWRSEKPIYRDVLIGLMAGTLFIASQWSLAIFLVSREAQNWVLGRMYFAYSDPAGSLYNPYLFQGTTGGNGWFMGDMMVAAALAVASIWAGDVCGRALRGVQRRPIITG